MTWYYANHGQREGPVSESEFETLVKAGVVNPATLVWQEGMSDWQPYARLVTPAPDAIAPPLILQTDPNAVQCSQCQQIFQKDEVVNLAGQNVCAACKPLVLQKLREGVPLHSPAGLLNQAFASFGYRVLGKILDGLIEAVLTNVPSFGIMLVFGATANPNTNPMSFLLLQFLVMAFGIGISMAYTVFFLYKYGATPGKMVLRMKVVRGDGSNLTLGRCFGRFFAELLTRCTCIGYFLVLFDDQKRALHDYICDTRVVIKPPGEPIKPITHS